jgi:hypothetical protein
MLYLYLALALNDKIYQIFAIGIFGSSSFCKLVEDIEIVGESRFIRVVRVSREPLRVWLWSLKYSPSAKQEVYEFEHSLSMSERPIQDTNMREMAYRAPARRDNFFVSFFFLDQ